MIDVVVNRKRHLGIAAIDRTRRGIDEVLDLRMAATFQNVQKSFDVAVRIGMRVHQGIAHTRLRRQMDHAPDRLLREQLLHPGPIG